jgi:hypothetical protein
MDTVRATSEVELVFVTGWRICLAHTLLNSLCFVVEQIMKIDLASISRRRGETEGT